MNKSVLIVVLVLALATLSTANPPYNAAANLAALEEKFNNYKLDLKKLRQSASEIKRTLSNHKTNTTLGIATLQ
jgi:hypothetical protein